MATLDHISGAEPSTITFKVRTVRFNQNSSNMHAEVLVIGDPDSTNALAAVLAGTPASTAWGLVVRSPSDASLATIAGAIKAEDSPSANADPLIVVGGILRGFIGAGGDPGTDGDYTPFKVDGNGALYVTLAQSFTANSVQDAASAVDGVPFTANASVVSLVGAMFDDVSPSTVAEGNSGILRMSSNRALYSVLRDAAGNERGANVTAAKQLSVWAQNSSAADLLVQISGNSTVAPLAGSTWNVRALQSSAADLQATVTPASGSTWNVRALNSSAADLQMTATPAAGSTWTVRPIQSSAADLQATVTPVAGSTWRTQPGSTLWASSAGFHFDSSGGLQISGSITASASTGPLTISQLLDSSGGSVTAADSANNAIRVNVVAGSAAGSTIVTVSTIQGAVIMRSSKADALITIYQSTIADLNATVTPLAGSTWNVRALNSSAADLQATVTPAAGSTWSVRPIQSSAADLQATVTPVAGSTWNVRALQSTAADLQVTATQSAAVWTVNLGTHIQSSVAPSSNSSGVVVRMVVDNILTTASSNAFTSTSLTIQSSAAAIRSYVTSYSILTTNAGPSKVKFYSGSTLLWPMIFAAVSSAVSGANLAVSAPAYLFRTKVAGPLSLQLSGGASTVAGWHVAVSYFRAP